MVFDKINLKSEAVDINGQEINVFELPAYSYYKYTDAVLEALKGAGEKDSDGTRRLTMIETLDLSLSLVAYAIEPGVPEDYCQIKEELERLDRASIDKLYEVANRLYAGDREDGAEKKDSPTDDSLSS